MPKSFVGLYWDFINTLHRLDLARYDHPSIYDLSKDTQTALNVYRFKK